MHPHIYSLTVHCSTPQFARAQCSCIHPNYPEPLCNPPQSSVSQPLVGRWFASKSHWDPASDLSSFRCRRFRYKIYRSRDEKTNVLFRYETKWEEVNCMTFSFILQHDHWSATEAQYQIIFSINANVIPLKSCNGSGYLMIMIMLQKQKMNLHSRESWYSEKLKFMISKV